MCRLASKYIEGVSVLPPLLFAVIIINKIKILFLLFFILLYKKNDEKKI